MTSDLATAVMIPDSGTLTDAMLSLKKTGVGIAIVVNDERKVVGVVTDGDIRSRLLETRNMADPVSSCMSKNFVSADNHTDRETLLKLLDSPLRAVPILDERGGLLDVIRSGQAIGEKKEFSRARAPARISLAGGGTDFTRYFMDHGGAGLTCTVTKFCHALLEPRHDDEIHIRSWDFRKEIQYADLSSLRYDGSLDLVKAGINLMKPEFGFDLEVGSDFPPSSGLGGSAALLSAIIGCFNEFRDQRLNRYQMAEYAFEAERIELRVSGGWQDQYSTVFGGFNFLEFNRKHNVVMPLRVESHTKSELEARFLLCHTGASHLGQQIQGKEASGKESGLSDEHKSELKEITNEMRDRLLRGDLDPIGPLLAATWDLKKKSDPRVSSPQLEKIYSAAIAAGSTGGRLLGTGGGGYFLFFVPPFARFCVVAALRDLGLNPENISLDEGGVVSWRY